MRPLRIERWACVLLVIAAGLAGAARADAQDARARREAILKLTGADALTIATLQAALADEDMVVARTAARVLTRKGRPALPALTKALAHEDMLVRRTAASGLGDIGPGALGLVAKALADPHVMVREAAVISLGRVRPRSERVLALIEQGCGDEAQGVREAALSLTRASYRTLTEVRLPKAGWKFKLDPDDLGRDGRFFAAELDDGAWDDIEIEAAWGDFGHDYVGIAWYRRTIELPELADVKRTELAFGGVDENAWVWVNGRFAGEHALGPTGWDKPFRLDVTDLARWGEENQITVRAMNSAFAGGIWQPVRVIALEPAR